MIKLTMLATRVWLYWWNVIHKKLTCYCCYQALYCTQTYCKALWHSEIYRVLNLSLRLDLQRNSHV